MNKKTRKKEIYKMINGLNWLSKLSFITHTTSQLENSFFRLLAGQNQTSNNENEVIIESFKPNGSHLVDQNKLYKGESVEEGKAIPPPKDLIRLCRQCDWNVFMQNCRNNPEKLHWIGSHGQNLLHFLCTRRPNLCAVAVFTTLHREAIVKEDHDGCLPIHMAMTNGASHEVICTLIRQAPETIFHANKWNYYPFDWIWKRCKYELKHVEEDEEEENRIWITIKELIRAASIQSGAIQSGTMLHLAMDFDCPVDMINCIIQRFPKLSMEKDSNGRTCLARAVSTKHIPSSELIQMLLEVDMKSALEADAVGRIPIHLAISNQISWSAGVCHLFRAAPISIQVKDPVTNLYPFQLMANQADKKDSHLSVTDLFELLSLCPSVLK